MGITIRSKNHSCDMGCGGFNRFRQLVAELHNEDFGVHYSILSMSEVQFMYGDRRVEYFKVYDAATHDFIKSGKVSIGVARFCYASDCDGKANRRRSRHIYNIIKDLDDGIKLGYVGRPDCATMADMKRIFQDCMENGGCVEWD